MVLKSSARPGSSPASSPTTSEGTRTRWSSGLGSTAVRIPARTTDAARHQTSGPASVSGAPAPAGGGPRPPPRRTAACRRDSRWTPGRPRRHSGSASTTTGLRTRHRRPRDSTARTVPRTSTCSPKRPETGRGSEVTTSSASTQARSAARSATGPPVVTAARAHPLDQHHRDHQHRGRAGRRAGGAPAQQREQEQPDQRKHREGDHRRRGAESAQAARPGRRGEPGGPEVGQWPSPLLALRSVRPLRSSVGTLRR